MGKIDIKIKVNNYKINTKGIKQNNIITCIDNNDNQTKIKIDTENLILKRENNDIIINIDFKNKNIEYFYPFIDKRRYFIPKKRDSFYYFFFTAG